MMTGRRPRRGAALSSRGDGALVWAATRLSVTAALCHAHLLQLLDGWVCVGRCVVPECAHVEGRLCSWRRAASVAVSGATSKRTGQRKGGPLLQELFALDEGQARAHVSPTHLPAGIARQGRLAPAQRRQVKLPARCARAVRRPRPPDPQQTSTRRATFTEAVTIHHHHYHPSLVASPDHRRRVNSEEASLVEGISSHV